MPGEPIQAVTIALAVGATPPNIARFSPTDHEPERGT